MLKELGCVHVEQKLGFCDRVKSSEIWESLRVQVLLFQIQEQQVEVVQATYKDALWLAPARAVSGMPP